MEYKLLQLRRREWRESVVYLMIGPIGSLKAEIDARQNGQVRDLALRGQLRAAELLWRETVKRKYQLQFPAFTNKEIANLKQFLGEYPKAVEIMEKALDRWAMMRLANNLNLLGPMPTFGEFFAHRQKIYVWLEADARRESAVTNGGTVSSAHIIMPVVVNDGTQHGTVQGYEPREPCTPPQRFDKAKFMEFFEKGRRQAREQQERARIKRERRE